MAALYHRTPREMLPRLTRDELLLDLMIYEQNLEFEAILAGAKRMR